MLGRESQYVKTCFEIRRNEQARWLRRQIVRFAQYDLVKRILTALTIGLIRGRLSLILTATALTGTTTSSLLLATGTLLDLACLSSLTTTFAVWVTTFQVGRKHSNGRD